MPELPEVDSVRRALAPVMVGARFDAVVLRRSNLRIPFPAGFVDRLVGNAVTAVTRRAKYLLVSLSSGETLLVHLGMSGEFRVMHQRVTRAYPGDQVAADDPRHDHVVFQMSSGATVTFNDARRFGLMDLVARDSLATHTALRPLGPEPLSPAFTAAALARACGAKKIAIKAALLDQRVVAGIGNIYASEALWLARLSPKRRAASLATPLGKPRPTAVRLVAAIVKVLEDAIEHVDPEGARFRVYERAGKRCPRRRCSGTLKRIVQGGRSTFYCPACQR